MRRSYQESTSGEVISLGVNGRFAKRPGRAEVPICYGKQAFRHSFDIGDPPTGISVIICRDLQQALGIAITGLCLPSAIQQQGNAVELPPHAGIAAYSAFSASTVSPRSLTSAKPPSMRIVSGVVAPLL